MPLNLFTVGSVVKERNISTTARIIRPGFFRRMSINPNE